MTIEKHVDYDGAKSFCTIQSSPDESKDFEDGKATTTVSGDAKVKVESARKNEIAINEFLSVRSAQHIKNALVIESGTSTVGIMQRELGSLIEALETFRTSNPPSCPAEESA